MKITNFEDLNCWKGARQIVVQVYKLTHNGAFAKDFGLRDQIQRASVSIMTNIAEGFHRYSNKESIRFLDFAQSSASEVKSLSYAAEDLGYITNVEAKNLRDDVNEVRFQTLALIKHYRSR